MLEKIFLSICELSISASLPILVFIIAAPVLNKRFAVKWNSRVWIFLALWLIVPIQKIVPFEHIAQIQIVNSDSFAKGQFIDGQSGRTNSAGRLSVEKQAAQKRNAPGPYRQLTVGMPHELTAPIIPKADQGAAGITWIGAAAVIWLLGSICIFGMHMYGFFHYKIEVMKEGVLIKDVQINRQVQEISQELGLRRKITLIYFEKAGSPMAVGFLHPLLILPDETYSSRELYYILKHELVHLKRRDAYFKLLLVIVNALHWLNPIVRIMCRNAVIDLELSCDEAVVKDTDLAGRKEYTQALLSAIHKQCLKKSSLSTQFYGGKQIMKKRFENILIKTKKKSGISVFICFAVFTTLLGSLTGCSMMDAFSEEAAGSANNTRSSSELKEGSLKADKNSSSDSENEDSNSENEDSNSENEDSNSKNEDSNSENEDSNSENEDSNSENEDNNSENEDGRRGDEPNEANQGNHSNEDTQETGSSLSNEKKDRQEDTERNFSSNEPVEILAYISRFDSDHMSLTFDEVEWVTVPGKRAEELGVEDSHADSGFYVNNEEEKLEDLPLGKDCKCLLLDWYASYERMEASVEELFVILEERKEIGNSIPYILTIQQNEIIKIEEHYVP